MNTKYLLAIGLVGLICGGAAAGDYDFYAATQYPDSA
jgi:hypothetical protein